MNQLNPDARQTVYHQAPDVVSRRIVDEYLLVPLKTRADELDSIYTLNEVGARIWELLDGKRTVAEMHEVIVAEFEVEPAAALADLHRFLEQLEAAGLAVTAP